MDMIDVSCPSYLLNEFQNMDYSTLKGLENDIVRVSTSGNVSFGNAIIGEYVLQNYDRKEDVIGAVVRFCNFVDAHPAQRNFQWIVRRLLRHRNLSRLLKSDTLPLEVFDRASHIPSVNGDPLFWVQYSISQMENGAFFPANRLLVTAYAKAEKRGTDFDTYQIDTHAARLTARKIAINGMYDGAARQIVEGVRKLRAVLDRRPEDTYHVAAVASQILTLDVQWADALKPGDYSSFRRDMLEIGKVISEPGNSGFAFAPEKQAIEMIRRLE